MTRQINAHALPLFSAGIRHWRPLLSSVALVLLSACSPYRPILHEEDTLARSGFVAHPADTTARWQTMNLLPANTMTYRMQGNIPVLLYADPTACGCVYMGNMSAYHAYQSGHHVSANEEQRMTAEINQHPGWDWSVWNWRADPDVVSGLRPGPVQVQY
ncbi:hypothetical protein [Gluconobacter cerinus]|uniref:hypothetical protein n=1 Tax=Gluconobacter cerinus TaxID=38307 RepID=UPI001B8CC8BF|nr:hypothetical protein [Gluconobacter cerinus]MBS1036974.1 hypothetical protein [Gluconobacter cerinus]